MSNDSLDTIESATAPENEQLRTENKRLETDTANLRKELARLRGTNLKRRCCLRPWSQLGREEMLPIYNIIAYFANFAHFEYFEYIAHFAYLTHFARFTHFAG